MVVVGLLLIGIVIGLELLVAICVVTKVLVVHLVESALLDVAVVVVVQVAVEADLVVVVHTLLLFIKA